MRSFDCSFPEEGGTEWWNWYETERCPQFPNVSVPDLFLPAERRPTAEDGQQLKRSSSDDEHFRNAADSLPKQIFA
jgi:hypothetical protein